MKRIVGMFIEKISKILADRSLMKKSMAVYIPIIAIPIVVFYIYAYQSLSSNARKDAIAELNYEINVESDAIEKNMYIMRNIVSTVDRDKKLLDFIAFEEDKDVRYLISFSDEKYKQLIGLQNNNPAIKQINIFSRNSNINEFWPIIYAEKRVAHNNWYKEVLSKDGAEYWNINHYDDDIKTETMFHEQNSDLIVSLNKVMKYSGSSIGVIRVTMKAEDFFPNMYKEEKLSKRQMYLINKNDLTIKTNEKNTVINDYGFDIVRFKEFLKGKLTGGRGETTYSQDGEEYVVLFKEAPMVDNYLVSIIPVGSITQSITESMSVLIFVAVLCLILLSIIIYFATKALLRRFYIILKAVKQVRTGDLMPAIPVYGTDEIGVLAHNLRQMMKTIDTLIKESINKEVMTKEAELRALKTQIDAHFLYNTLENIRMMAVVEENFMVSDCLASLGDMMRYNMKWNNEFVPLKEELNHIKNYVALMTLRYDYRINLKVDIDSTFLDKLILKLTIQPLVENAVKHGISEKLRDGDGNVVISIDCDDTSIYLSVEDDGRGMDDEDVKKLQDHIYGNMSTSYGLGLKNVNERIKLFYGDKYGITVESKIGAYTKIIMKLPKQDN
ncbi:cache domain-containing sensor histidine kinase [Clostridium thermarum]|uniref:cache domain-containing sensor histidine kinase n=1 Tax=Clostridium thermarum TaxID=1716543 RepID=UPI001120FBB0|nr:sensor histidine kinase [Clostridium thermarum]